MNEQDPPRLSLHDDNALLRDAIEDSKRDLPDETRLAAIAMKLGPLLGAGAVGGGGAAAASSAGAAKASVAPAAAKIGAMSASMKLATAVAVTIAIGGTAVVAPRLVSSRSTVRTSTVGGAPTTTTMATSPSATNSSTTMLALPPASASAAPFASMKPLVIPPRSADEETKALAREEDALKTDPEYALAQCDDDAKLFPHDQFAQERETTAIAALVKLGRMPEAKARAKKFARDYPGSADIPHLQTLVGN